MHADARNLLWDARQAAERVVRFTHGKTFGDYQTDGNYIRAANITEAGLDLSDVLDMEFLPAEQERFRLMRGDLVFSSPGALLKQAIKERLVRNEAFQARYRWGRERAISRYE